MNKSAREIRKSQVRRDQRGLSKTVEMVVAACDFSSEHCYFLIPKQFYCHNNIYLKKPVECGISCPKFQERHFAEFSSYARNREFHSFVNLLRTDQT